MPEHTLTGYIRCHPDFESRILRNRRDVLVYLPPGYRRARTRRFPVLYLHDGQNLFDAATAFNGVEWGADETAQRLVQQKLIEPVIIVAVREHGRGSPPRIRPHGRARFIRTSASAAKAGSASTDVFSSTS